MVDLAHSKIRTFFKIKINLKIEKTRPLDIIEIYGLIQYRRLIRSMKLKIEEKKSIGMKEWSQ